MLRDSPLPFRLRDTEFPAPAKTGQKPVAAQAIEAERVSTMKVSVNIEATVARSIATRYDLAKFQSALDADYNKAKIADTDQDSLAVKVGDGQIKSAKGTEAKGAQAHGVFKSKDGFEVEREGRLNNPRRMIAWLVAWAKFTKANGSPSGEMEFTITDAGLVTHPVIPASLLFWLESTFLKDEFKPKAKDTAKDTAKPAKPGNRRNGNVDKVQTPEPAK